MKYLVLLLTPVLAYAADPAPKKLEMQWKPKCAEVKIEDYMKAYDSCLKEGNIDDVCKCVAQGLVLEPSCEEHKKLNTDKKAQEALGKKLVESCKPGSQKAAPKLKK